VISVFNAIHCDRKMLVQYTAVIRAKRGTEPGVHKLLANYQTDGYNLQARI